MSYLLDALRKAEQERNLGQPPDLRALPPPSAERRGSRWPWIVGVAVLLIANGALAGWLLWPRTPAPQIAAPAMPAPPMNPVVSAPSPSPAPSPAPTLAPVKAAPAPPPPVVTETAVAPDPPPPPVTVETSLPPPLFAMPAGFRQALPQLNLDVHVFSPEPQRRFVMINAVQYRIGDNLREGPQVQDIVNQGAILTFLGQRFLLPVER